MNASHNQITSIPSTALKDLSNLKELDISNNKLTHILDNQFSSLVSIESINASHNELNSVQRFTFTDLKTLQTLDLSTNQLYADDFLEHAAPLKSIHVQSNAYHRINLSSFKTVDNVYLNKNPWNCSWLLKALAKKEHLITNVQFGFEVDDFEHEHDQLIKPLTEEVECYDYRQSLEHPTTRRFVIINIDCDAIKNEKKVNFVWLLVWKFCYIFSIVPFS